MAAEARALRAFLLWFWRAIPPDISEMGHAISNGVKKTPFSMTQAPILVPASSTAIVSTVASKTSPSFPTTSSVSSVHFPDSSAASGTEFVNDVMDNSFSGLFNRLCNGLFALLFGFFNGFLTALSDLFKCIVSDTSAFFTGFFNALSSRFNVMFQAISGFSNDIRHEINWDNFSTDMMDALRLLTYFMVLLFLTWWLAPRLLRLFGPVTETGSRQLTSVPSSPWMRQQSNIFNARYQRAPSRRSHSTGSVHRRNRVPELPLAPASPIASPCNANTPTRIISYLKQKVSLIFTNASPQTDLYTGPARETTSLVLVTTFFVIAVFAYHITWPEVISDTDFYFFLWCGKRTGAIWCVIRCFRNRDLAMPFFGYLEDCLQHWHWHYRIRIWVFLVKCKEHVVWIILSIIAFFISMFAWIWNSLVSSIRAFGRMIAAIPPAVGNLVVRICRIGWPYVERHLIATWLFSWPIVRRLAYLAVDSVDNCVYRFFDKLSSLVFIHFDQPRLERDTYRREAAKYRREASEYREMTNQSNETIARLQNANRESVHMVEILEARLAEKAPSDRRLQAHYDKKYQILKAEFREAKANSKAEIALLEKNAKAEWARQIERHRQTRRWDIDIQEQEIQDLEKHNASLDQTVKKLKDILRRVGAVLSPDGTLVRDPSLQGYVSRERAFVDENDKLTKDLEKSGTTSTHLLSWATYYQEQLGVQTGLTKEAETKSATLQTQVDSLESQLAVEKSKPESDSRKDEIEALKTELDAANKSREASKKLYLACKTSLNTTSYWLLSTKAAHEKTKKELEATKEALEATQEPFTQQAKIQALQIELDAAKKETVTAKAAHDTTSEELRSANTAHEATKTELETEKKATADLSARHKDESQKLNADLAKSQADLQKSESELSNAKDQMRAEGSQWANEKAELTDAKAKLVEEKDKLAEDKGKADMKSEMLQTQLGRLQRKLAALEAGSDNKPAAPSEDKPSTEKPESDKKTFDATFPHGYETLPTSSEDEHCGLYAVIATIAAMRPNLPCPTIDELLEALNSKACQDNFTEFEVDPPKKFFSVDELALILGHWANAKGLVVYMGYVKEIPEAEEEPFLEDPHIITPDNEDPKATVVWVYHDGADGHLAHFWGMKPKPEPSIAT